VVTNSLGQARAGLDVGVERDRDCGEDADDRDDDHQLDEREAALLVPTAKDMHDVSCHERSNPNHRASNMPFCYQAHLLVKANFLADGIPQTKSGVTTDPSATDTQRARPTYGHGVSPAHTSSAVVRGPGWPDKLRGECGKTLKPS
jgi:hypothetical protein